METGGATGTGERDSQGAFSPSSNVDGFGHSENTASTAMALIVLSILWICLFPAITAKGSAAGDSVLVAVLFLTAPILMPILGFLCVRKQPRSWFYGTVLFPAFILSLLPAAIIACLLLVVWFVPAPGHVDGRGTRKVSLGLTKAQLVQRIGMPERAAGDGHSETLFYVFDHLLTPDTTFRVTVVDGKVAAWEHGNR